MCIAHLPLRCQSGERFWPKLTELRLRFKFYGNKLASFSCIVHRLHTPFLPSFVVVQPNAPCNAQRASKIDAALREQSRIPNKMSSRGLVGHTERPSVGGDRKGEALFCEIGTCSTVDYVQNCRGENTFYRQSRDRREMLAVHYVVRVLNEVHLANLARNIFARLIC